MHPLIARLDRWTAGHRPDYYAALAPGAAPERVDELLGDSVPPLLREMLVWRDGDDQSMAFLHNQSYMAVERIRETMDLMSEMVEAGEFDTPNWWCPDWIPFLDGAGGDNVCVDRLARIGGTPGQIVQFWHDDHIRPIVHASFEDWLATHVAALEAGLLADAENGNFEETDDEAYQALVAGHNPGYPIWIDLEEATAVP